MTKMQHESIDCIVRFHDSSRLRELNRCVFSLVGQNYGQIQILLMTQAFTKKELKSLEKSLQPLLYDNRCTLRVINVLSRSGEDARTKLLNAGLKYCTSKYVSFLDYDDVLYPEAYALLVQTAEKTSAAILFASVRMGYLNVTQNFNFLDRAVSGVFKGSSLLDLFAANFCPIHSYLINRDIVGDDLYFDELLTWEEDYDLLLRITAKYKSDFSLNGTEVGDYYHKNDLSNSVGAAGLDGTLPGEKLIQYEYVSALIEARRRATDVSPAVLREMGCRLDSSRRVTIRGVLDYLDRRELQQ